MDPATDSWKACTLEECVTYFSGKAPETTAASEAEAATFTFHELLCTIPGTESRAQSRSRA